MSREDWIAEARQVYMHAQLSSKQQAIEIIADQLNMTHAIGYRDGFRTAEEQMGDELPKNHRLSE